MRTSPLEGAPVAGLPVFRPLDPSFGSVLDLERGCAEKDVSLPMKSVRGARPQTELSWEAPRLVLHPAARGPGACPVSPCALSSPFSLLLQSSTRASTGRSPSIISTSTCWGGARWAGRPADQNCPGQKLLSIKACAGRAAGSLRGPLSSQGMALLAVAEFG